MRATEQPADPVAAARREFAAHNMMLGAEILRATAHNAVAKAAGQHGWPCATPEQAYDILEKLDDSLALISGYMYAEGLPDKIRYRYAEIADGEMETDCWVVAKFLERLADLTGISDAAC